MKKLSHYFTKHQNELIRKELVRAHVIITVLSLAIISLLGLGVNQPVQFDGPLSAIIIVLLSFVTVISLVIAIVLASHKK